MSAGYYQRKEYVELHRYLNAQNIATQLVTYKEDTSLLRLTRKAEGMLRISPSIALKAIQTARECGAKLIVPLSEDIAVPLATAKLSKQHNYKLAVTLHHPLSNRQYALYRTMPQILQAWDHIFFISEWERQSFIAQFPQVEAHSSALLCPVDGRFFQQPADPNDAQLPDNPYIYAAGASKRHFPAYAQLARRLQAVYPQLQVSVDISSPWEGVKSTSLFGVGRLPSNLQVLHPAQNSREYRALVKHATLCFLATRESTQQAAGCTTITTVAMSDKLPVVCANAGLRDYYGEQAGHYLFAPDVVEAWIEQVVAVLADVDAHAQAVQEVKQHVGAVADLDAVWLPETMRVVQRLMG